MEKGLVALVTGGSKGIGFGIASALAESTNPHVASIILVARTQEDLVKAKEVLEAKYHKRIDTISADLTKPESYQTIYDYVLSTYGHLDILVNNAGDFQQIPRNEHDSPSTVAQDVAKLIAINATAPAAMVHAMRGLMLKSRAPKQLDVLSSAALEIFSGNNPYGPTKVAHERVSLSTFVDSNGAIRTYRVYPSNTDTGLVKHFDSPKLTTAYVGAQAAMMMLSDSATDLYLKKTEAGVKRAEFKLDYSKFIHRQQVNSLELVSEHAQMKRMVFEPALKSD